MRYFGETFVEALNNCDFDTEEKCLKEFRKAYKKARKRLSKEFIEQYESVSKFHDMFLCGIAIEEPKLNTSNVRVVFYDDEKYYTVLHQNVRRIDLSMDLHEVCPIYGPRETCLYCEMTVAQKGYLSHEISFSCLGSIRMIFKQISIITSETAPALQFSIGNKAD